MTRSFDFAYIYARICGNLAGSFLGPRAASLARCRKLSEAWRLVFGDEPPALPLRALVSAADARLETSAMESLRAIAGPAALYDPVIRALARRREMSCLKRLIAAAAAGRDCPDMPVIPDSPVGKFVEAYPDIPRMVEKTPYEWIAKSKNLGLDEIKLALDRQYFRDIFAGTAQCSDHAARSRIASLASIEVELLDIIWAFRLARYYSMDHSHIQDRLIDVPGRDVKAAAMTALSFRQDVRSDWQRWKWNHLVPDTRSEDSGSWSFDLREFETAAAAYLYRTLKRALHLENGLFVPLYSYFKIKEIEASILRGVFEGIVLEAPEEEIAAFALQVTGGAA